MQAYENFDVRQVPLAGTNLIEASAGTGKTYSIALLVLRLILDKGLAVNQILMVTFTKAAVAELESRIRLFIRLAYKSDEKTNAAFVFSSAWPTSRPWESLLESLRSRTLFRLPLLSVRRTK